MVTLKELADELGTSMSTVSRALAGKPGVSASVRKSITDAARRAGYQPPTRAPGAPRGVLVGVIVPELDNPIFPQFGQAIGTLLASQGHLPVLCSQSAGGISEDQWIELLLERGLGGLIVVSGMHADTHAPIDRYRAVRARGIPLVLVNGHVPGLDATSISTDDARAVREAVQHLRELGHRRIGLVVGPTRYVPVIRKIEGFRQAVGADPAIAASEELIESAFFTIEGGYAATSALIQRGATAVICASDMMALGAIHAGIDNGLRVPEQLSVVGFDDSAFGAHTAPPLTTLRQPVKAMATAAVRALLEELRDGRTPRKEYLFRPEFVLRSSTAAPAGSPASQRATPRRQ